MNFRYRVSDNFLGGDMTTGTAANLYKEGKLSEAIQNLIGEVKKHPTDASVRGLLADLLCFDGQLDRVDVHLNAISNQDPEKGVPVALYRQLVRAAVAREQLFGEGRLPEFLEPPPEHVQNHVKAVVALREGKPEEALALINQAEETRPPVAGRMDDVPFSDMRDMDDVFGPVVELLTSTGKYFWVPIESIELIEFHAPERPRDLVWRQARMVVGETDGEVYIPAIYPFATGDETVEDGLKLGRATDWQEAEQAPVRGRGQRCFLIGEEAVPVMSLTNIEFTGAN